MLRLVAIFSTSVYIGIALVSKRSKLDARPSGKVKSLRRRFGHLIYLDLTDITHAHDARNLRAHSCVFRRLE